MGSNDAGPRSIGPSTGEARCACSFIQPVLHLTQTCGSTALSASSLRVEPLRSSATAWILSPLPTHRGITCSLLRLPTLPQNRHSLEDSLIRDKLQCKPPRPRKAWPEWR